MRRCGPILYFRGQEDELWRLAVLVVHEGTAPPPPLLPEGAAAPVVAEPLGRRLGHGLWRHDFALRLAREERAASYRIGEESWTVNLPPVEGARRLAYAACNGHENERPGGPTAERNRLWTRLAAVDREGPFHLLLHGGDQLYADPLWQAVPELGAWRKLPWQRGNAHPFTPAMAAGAERFYFDSYRALWSEPEVATLLASLPSVMMWDDHDIFDGWGSWPPDRQGSPVFQGVRAVARENFALFQLAARPDALPEHFADRQGGHFGCAFRAGPVGIIVPDLRSLRSREQIMGEAGWQGFCASLDRLAGVRHLVVMSSTPLTHVAMPWLERIYVTIPGHNDLEDDLRDQWQSFGHRLEWQRMLATLGDFAARTGAQVISVSGEIHLGALGKVLHGDQEMIEFTSSGIVHPPPPALFAAALRWLARRDTVLAPDLIVRRLRIPGYGSRYLRARNWLALDLEAAGSLEARWHTEAGTGGAFQRAAPRDRGEVTQPAAARQPASAA